MKNKHLYKICECAVLIALSIALMPIEIPGPAFGGDIDLVMIPLFILAYRNGALYGIASGAVFGFLKCLIGGGIGWGLPSVLLDYVLAYAAVGFAGFFKEKFSFFFIRKLNISSRQLLRCRKNRKISEFVKFLEPIQSRPTGLSAKHIK